MTEPNIPRPVFVSYAHKDNESADSSKRWLDRFKEFLEPLVQQDELTDPRTGPERFTLASIQAAGSPNKALSQMTEAEQDETFLQVARALIKLVSLNPS